MWLISCIRFIYNDINGGKDDKEALDFGIPILIIGLLSSALIWTYVTLAYSFYMYFTVAFSDRNFVVAKVFDADYDQF